MTSKRVVIVGGGLAAWQLDEVGRTGLPCDLISLTPVKRSHSVCAQGESRLQRSDSSVG